MKLIEKDFANVRTLDLLKRLVKVAQKHDKLPVKYDDRVEYNFRGLQLAVYRNGQIELYDTNVHCEQKKYNRIRNKYVMSLILMDAGC